MSDATTPIVVNNSPLEAMAFGLLRNALTTAGGSLVTAGVISQTQEDTIIGGLLTAFGIGWTLYKNKKTHDEKKTMARAVPDSVAVVK